MDIWAKFVEGRVNGVIVDKSCDTVEVLLAANDHNAFMLKAHGVRALQVLEMKMSNIIDRVSTWGDSADEAEYLDDLWLAVYGEEVDKSVTSFQDEIRLTLNAVKENKLTLLKIEPVFGALIVMLVKSYELHPHIRSV